MAGIHGYSNGSHIVLWSMFSVVNIILAVIVAVVAVAASNTPQCIVVSIKNTKLLLLLAMNYALIVRAF